MERLYWPSGAPLATEQESFDEGYQIGLNWTDNYRPGGPFVHSEHHTRNCKEQARQSNINNAAWLRGFDQGLKDKVRE